SLGAILYELLAGRPPFVGATPLETMRKALEEEPVPPGRFTNDDLRMTSTESGSRVNRKSKIVISIDLETICLKCLEKEPTRRYPSARALAEDLDRWTAGEPIAARPVGAGERVWRWCRRKPALAALASTAVVAVVAGL